MRDREVEKREGKKIGLVFYPGRLNDHGYIDVKCSEGHETVIVYDERKFELLFQSACHTLNDGYEREAVSGFAASTERLYEFFVRVAIRHSKMNPEVFRKTWKMMSRQSERQLGGFLLTYALHTGTAFEMDTKQVEFRNKVIHQGYIPTTQEVMSFGRETWRIKRNMYKTLQKIFPNELEKEIHAEISEIEKKIPNNKSYIMFKAQVVNVDTNTNTGHEIEEFEQFLDGMRRRWDRNT